MSGRVLLVEDDAWYANQQQRILRAAGYQVSWARDAYEAIERIDEECYDALVVDMLLTHNTVMGLLHELQSNSDTSHIPVVVYTAQASLIPQGSLEAYGVVALFDKTTMNPKDSVYALRKAGL